MQEVHICEYGIHATQSYSVRELMLGSARRTRPALSRHAQRPTLPPFPAFTRLPTISAPCPNDAGALAVSHRINLTVPRDEHQHRQLDFAQFRRRQLSKIPTAGLYATPQHEPSWSVSPESPLSHHYLCDRKLEIACTNTTIVLQLPRQPNDSRLARTGSMAFHSSSPIVFLPASTFPHSASSCPYTSRTFPEQHADSFLPTRTGATTA